MIADLRNAAPHSVDRVQRERRAVLVHFEALEMHVADDIFIFREERCDLGGV